LSLEALHWKNVRIAVVKEMAVVRGLLGAVGGSVSSARTRNM